MSDDEGKVGADQLDEYDRLVDSDHGLDGWSVEALTRLANLYRFQVEAQTQTAEGHWYEEPDDPTAARQDYRLLADVERRLARIEAKIRAVTGA